MQKEIHHSSFWANPRRPRNSKRNEACRPVKRNRLIILFVGYSAIFIQLSGCVSYPEKHSFMLNVSRLPQTRSTVTEKALKVARFRAAAPYENKNFVYRKGDIDYESDYYNAFLTLPGDMMTDTVREWLVKTGLFKFVVDSEDTDEPHYNLEGFVKSLYGDYSQTGTPRAILEIRLSLSQKEKDRSVLVFQKEYREQLPLQQDSPAHLVQGWNEALYKILTAFEEDLIRSDLKWQLK